MEKKIPGITGDNYRISVLTDGLVRLEYSADGQFEDRPTQVVVNRSFAPVEYTLEPWGAGQPGITVTTKRLKISYDGAKFSPQGLSVAVTGDSRFPDRFYGVWHFGEQPQTLGGTARTLDSADGACALGDGIISRQGYAVLDDSHSLAITADGWVEARPQGVIDLYFWGYGHDYLTALRDFYHLCGPTPLLPRFVFGNWWSRYHAYTEESYLALMKRFAENALPFSVAVIDMDWHLVDIDPQYGSGWTGYTWNRELFPDPPRFLRRLHERGLRVTLNVHPADGVRAFEERYPQMARALGMDPAAGKPIPFEPGSRAFMDAYLKELHHPMEAEGVDFWWIDWQQGTESGMEGLDPLWMLNVIHFADSGRQGKRPLTFSRYAGPGSHRYPIGFSGDTIISWASLKFQPYFTATASNIGYGWWSHDIGGHMFGKEGQQAPGQELGELLVRWMQLGVFSPINRLHSSKGLDYHKEPWYYKGDERMAMEDCLRLRHRLIPYLYTMNARCHYQGVPLVCPMYYGCPEQDEAYAVPNQYWFGSELLVVPITEPADQTTRTAQVTAWLPEGDYIDFFTGERITGGGYRKLSRDIRSIPVLAKAGAVIPLAEEQTDSPGTANPQRLVLRVYGGADGRFELYEDDNETVRYRDGDFAVTPVVWEQQSRTLRILPVRGRAELVPERREYVIEYVSGAGEDGSDARMKRVTVPGVRPQEGISIRLEQTVNLVLQRI